MPWVGRIPRQDLDMQSDGGWGESPRSFDLHETLRPMTENVLREWRIISPEVDLAGRS